MDSVEPEEIERLLMELKDDRRDVRSRAAYELGKHPDPRALTPLIEALADNDKFVRSWAAGALGKAGEPAVAPLLEVLEGPDATVGYYAALALGQLGDVRAVPALANAIREGDWDIRPSAASALANLGDAKALPCRILADDRLSAQQRVESLAALQGVSYHDDEMQIQYELPDLAIFLTDAMASEDQRIRSGAEGALRALESARPGPAVDCEPVSPRIEDLSEPPMGSPAEQEAVDAPRQLAANPDKPKRTLWSRLTGRQ